MRAVAFHAGTLRRLAKGGQLENVTKISTVSGGSIFMAAVLTLNGNRWPTSAQYLELVYPKLQALVTSTSILSWRTFLLPTRWWNLLFNRARLLASALGRQWGIKGQLDQLSHKPEWIINTTCYQTGKNWRFSRAEMGDWVFGRHFKPDFPVADVVAASAAVPYAIGALKFKLPVDGWYQVVGRAEAQGEPKKPSSSAVHLWDGGAYENLGLEPLYKVETGATCDYILVSDASGPVMEGKSSLLLAMFRGNLPSPKLFDIASDQIRSLRSRMIVDAFQRKAARGAIFRMGNSVREVDRKSGRERAKEEYDKFLDDGSAAVALRYPTNLSAMKETDYTRIARHGFELAEATLSAYCKDLAPESMLWS